MIYITENYILRENVVDRAVAQEVARLATVVYCHPDAKTAKHSKKENANSSVKMNPFLNKATICLFNDIPKYYIFSGKITK